MFGGLCEEEDAVQQSSGISLTLLGTICSTVGPDNDKMLA